MGDLWRDVALLAISCAGAVITALGIVLWQSLQSAKKDINNFKEMVQRDFQRRDDTNRLEERIMSAIGEVRDMVHALLERK